MQVQLTTFESEYFPLAIEDNEGLMQMNQTDISVDIQSTSTTRSKVTLAIGKGARLDRRADDKMFRSTNSAAGTNTLSIIGQIEPGRTVRLYRQIH